MRRKNVPPVFKWRHFSPDVILLCVRWYLSYQLSYRDLVEMMDERGLKIAHSTILRWVLKYSMELKKRVRHHLKKRNRSWRMDETYIKVNGEWKYLFRAVDSNGETIDFYLSHTRDTTAAVRFFERICHHRSPHFPRVINVDKNPAYTNAKRQLMKTKSWGQRLVLRQNKYLNNIIEQDHRCIKRKMRQAMGFYSMITAEKTITGIETMHQLRKGQVPFIDGKKEPQCCRNFIHRCFGITGPIFPTVLNRPCPLSVS